MFDAFGSVLLQKRAGASNTTKRNHVQQLVKEFDKGITKKRKTKKSKTINN